MVKLCCRKQQSLLRILLPLPVMEHGCMGKNQLLLDGDRVNRWTRHGSTRYLWKEAEVEATIQYVVNEQGLPMAVFENINRTFNMAI